MRATEGVNDHAPDATVVVPFDSTRSAESAEEFVTAVLVNVAATRAVVVGEDFHFGRHREGNVAMLRRLGVHHDFEVFPIELVARPDGVDEPVSSTAIRRALVSVVFGQLTVSTPSRRSATIRAVSTGSGSWKVRLNSPWPRSTRW